MKLWFRRRGNTTRMTRFVLPPGLGHPNGLVPAWGSPNKLTSEISGLHTTRYYVGLHSNFGGWLSIQFIGIYNIPTMIGFPLYEMDDLNHIPCFDMVSRCTASKYGACFVMINPGPHSLGPRHDTEQIQY